MRVVVPHRSLLRRPVLALALAGLVVCACVPRPSAGVMAAPADPEVDALVAVLKDRTKDVDARGAACTRLMEMGARAAPAVPALIALLQDSDALMRDYAISTLARIGPAAAKAVPALRKVAAGDPSEDIRSLARDAVEKIGGAAAGDTAAGGAEAQPVKPVRGAAAPGPAAPAPRFGPAPSGRPAHDMSFMGTMYPELRTMPAPAWVKPGAQMTYYAASATIAGQGPVFQLDPQGEIFASDGSGRRFSVKPSGRGFGAGGHGYGVYTIVAVDRGSAAVAAESYTIPSTGSPMLMSHVAVVGPPACAGDLWVNPAWLKGVKTGLGKVMRVFRTPFKAGDGTHRAVAFSSSDGQMVFIYDENTGALLYRSGSGEGEKGLNLRINGQHVPNTPSRMLTLSNLMGQRTVRGPVARQSVPGWMGAVRSIRYAGQVGYVVPGSPNIPTPMSLDFRATSRGPGWVRFNVTMLAGGAGGATPIRTEEQWMAGADDLFGLWLAPNVLAELRPGQQLDRNPVTGFTLSVARTATGPNGKDMVVLSLAGPTQRIDHGYDRASGMLATIDEQRRGPAGTLQGRLILRSIE